MEKPKHYWEHGPNPTSPIKQALRIALEPWNNAWVGTSKSHGWEWHRQPYPENFQGSLSEGDPSAFRIRRGYLKFPSLILAENRWFGWQQTRIIQPNLKELDSSRVLEWWKYGWSPAWSELDRAFLEVCDIRIFPDIAVRIFEGPRPFRVHGVGSDDLEVPLIVSPKISRRDPRYYHIPLA